MSWYEWRPYVPVATRRRKAEQELKRRKKKGQSVASVIIDGRTIAKSFWGKSWCANLEALYDNRIAIAPVKASGSPFAETAREASIRSSSFCRAAWPKA